MSNATILSGFGGIGVLHYDNSTTPVNGPFFQVGLTHLIENSPSIKLNPLGNVFIEYSTLYFAYNKLSKKKKEKNLATQIFS